MSEQELKIVVFRLKDEEYGVNVLNVLSIERVSPITRVPKTPSFVKGVMNLRGVVTPVIDLRSRFGMEEKDADDDTRIIIVNTEGMDVGLIVDAANDVLDLSLSDIEPTPEVAGGINARYLDGVAKMDGRLFILLRLDKVLDKDEIMELQGAADES
ncbi:purine-binding chemotaxis protein CheW [Fictibacillus enclensis]|uniref:Chemotaxis protein CheW n=1 Tax=Fictibacillus enclensis TaxID=1017270 RepID=A0A0V8JDV7_9BACL|nr:chemotaxis protein CheW [Fictibacillus enclensis]KSU85089.1 chemotaxis protein CheW [Fictibacillus enclensis]SCB90732.1 purine-binding chemotaxis protein CheW [Fictibacillus enclensis]